MMFVVEPAIWYKRSPRAHSDEFKFVTLTQNDDPSSLNGQKDSVRHGTGILVNRNIESLSVFFLMTLTDVLVKLLKKIDFSKAHQFENVRSPLFAPPSKTETGIVVFCSGSGRKQIKTYMKTIAKMGGLVMTDDLLITAFEKLH